MKGHLRYLLVGGLLLFILSAWSHPSSGKTERAALVAEFSYSFEGGFPCAGVRVDFVDDTEPVNGTIIRRTWEFGDEGSSQARTPSYVFESEGLVTVRLTVEESDGTIASVEETIDIELPPTVDFVVDPTTEDQCDGTTQVFQNTSAVGSDFVWDFGDGSATSDAENPTHDFPAPGTYTVTLVATNPGTGCAASIAKQVTITPLPTLDFTFEDPCSGSPVKFENNTVVAMGNLSHAWTFGDGETSDLASPSHTYAPSAAGTSLNVTLTATTEAGCSRSLTQTVNVNEQPEASFSTSDECFGETVTFTNSTTSATDYVWDFDDNRGSTEIEPDHVYSQPGFYRVTLTANNGECSDETSEFVQVFPNPVAKFSVEDQCVQEGLALSNESEISSGEITYEWDFEEGTILTTEEPSFAYGTAGSYNIALEVTSTLGGCIDQMEQPVTIFPETVAGSILGETTYCSSEAATGTLQLQSHVGAILRWERSSNGVDQWLTIDETGAILNYSNLNESTYYRAVVQSGNCLVKITAPVKIQIDPAPVGGAIDGSTEVCDDDNAGSLLLHGFQGTVEGWLSSTDSDDGPWTPVANTSTVLAYNDLQQTTHYRAIVSNGVCDNDTSEAATIVVFPLTIAGAITDAATVCFGDNNGTLSLGGHVGEVIRWESSPTLQGPWSTIENRSATLTYDDLVATTFYRAVVQSGVCVALPTEAVKITVDALTLAGEISGPQAVCGTENQGVLELEDYAATSFQWQFSTNQINWQDDASTSTSLNFEDLTQTTYYRVIVQNGVCATETTEVFEVVFNPLPAVDFESTAMCEGLATELTNQTQLSFGEIESYLWDFGTGVAAVLEDPTYQFPGAGTYDVTLKVTSEAGCENTETKQVVVHPVPVSSFTQQDVCDGSEMSFTSNSSIASGDIVGTQWDFDDGTAGSGASVGYTYAQPGTYNVSMISRSDFGCTSTSTKEVEVFPNADVQFAFQNVCDGLAAAFENNTSVEGGTATYLWNFGDGATSVEIHPSHLYTGPGSRQVTLQATSDHGCVTSKTQDIEVHEQPIASFTVDNQCFGVDLEFVNSSTLSDVYSWQFGDETTSSLLSPTHQYETPGTFSLVLEVSNTEGCMDRAEGTVTVYPVPVASFEVQDICQLNEASLLNTSEITSGSMTYTWAFGDGTSTSIETSPKHQYPATSGNATAVYDITLVVTSTLGGCEDQEEKSITVWNPTLEGSILGATVRCADDEVVQELEVEGELGSILRWERSPTGTNQWSSLEVSGDVFAYNSLGQTTYFRAAVQNGLCPEQLTDVATVQIDSLSKGGTVLGSMEVCDDANNGELTLTDEVGDIVGWLSSTQSNEGPWTEINETTPSLAYNDLQSTSFFRVITKSGVCRNDTSSAATITVFPATDPGLLSGATVVCEGGNSGQMELSQIIGKVRYWESSSTANGPWNTIDHEEIQLSYEDLLTTTYYRSVVQSGVCEERTTNQIVITVDELTEVGEISGASSVCGPVNEGTLILSEEVGAVVKWQRSEDAVSWEDMSNDTFTQTFTDLSADTYYRAQVQNGVCDTETSQPFRVFHHPLPEVAFRNDEVCEELVTTFTNASSITEGTIEEYRWDFSTGVSSVSQDPTYQFPAAGSYGVQLMATSAAGCIDSTTIAVIVHPNPVADFEQEDVCDDVTMNFTNLSSVATGNIVSNSWDFGDGAESLLTEPNRLYDTAGVYNVRLLVTTDKGCTDDASRAVEVFPLAVVDFDFSSVCDGQAVPFSNNTIINGATATYQWDFGDNEQSSVQNPSHVFSEDGSYEVKLTATTQDNCETFVVRTVEIYEQPVASFEMEGQCLGVPVAFQDGSTGANLDHDWNLGDDIFSSLSDPQHYYATAGSYDVRLLVSNDKGCQDDTIRQVKIHPNPMADFFTESVCDTVTARFSNLSSITSGTMSYQWNFGDGNGSMLPAPTHLYAQEGSYLVQLLATSDFGCQDSINRPITVHPRPEAGFVVAPVCDGFPSVFQDQSQLASGEILSYLWDFGDETNAIVASPTKQYLNDGVYLASLLVTSDQGCEDRVTQPVTVHEVPIADFDVENVCIGFLIEPENLSFISGDNLLQGGSLLYTWDFGDGATSSNAFPQHLYEAPGVYTVALEVTSVEECKDRIEKDVVIYDLPPADAGRDTTLSQGFSVALAASGGVDYLWSPIDGLSNSNIANPIATPLETTTYTLLVTDQFGCEQTDTLTITVEEDFKLIANNVFTPDGNGMNDTWVIQNVETFGTVNVRVYDRYGTLVFQDEAYQNDWNGTFGNDILPDGTYFYLITFSDAPVQYKGSLTIIRNR